MYPYYQDFLIALGGNLPSQVGSPAQTLRAALQDLQAAGLQVTQVSTFYETPCFPAGAGPDYVNAAACLRADLTPQEILEILHQVEARHGRERVNRWGMRSLDLDLIAAGETVLPDLQVFNEWRHLSAQKQRETAPAQLILPHPRLQDRAFVLGPLKDIAADWKHPVSGLTVAQMWANLPESDRQALKSL